MMLFVYVPGIDYVREIIYYIIDKIYYLISNC